MAGLSDDVLLRVGLALQKYRQHSPDSDIPVPRYVIMGSQSAGKTRLISTLARTKIGGAEKMHCGTRCPVEYTFEPSEPGSEPEFCFGTSVSDLNAGSASHVARFVTQHMDKLAEQERVNRSGFSTEPIFVQVKSPGAEPLVATDCPGLQGQDNEKNNTCIRAIYRAQLQAQNSVAVIVSALPATLDMQQITKELEEFVRNAKLPKDFYRGALLLVNRLDAVKTSLDKSNEPLREFQKQAEEKYGLSQEHMGFMCLVPEVLGSQHSTRIVKDDAPIEEQNEYFASRMWEVEKQALQQFAEVHLGQERPPDNVGVHACIGLVHADLKHRIMLGFNKVLESLRREWSDTLEPQLDRMMLSTEVDDDELREELYKYLCIFCDGLAAFQTDDLPRLLGRSVQKVNWGCVSDVDAASRRRLKTAGKTFTQECEEETLLPPADALDTVLLHRNTRLELEEAPLHAVSRQMDFHFLGEKALERLVTMLKFAWMRQPLRKFSEEEIANFGGAMDGENIRGPSLGAIVRKAAQQIHAESAKDVTRLMSMTKRILMSLCGDVKSVLREAVPMLQGAPKLRDFIDEECVTRHFMDLTSMWCTEATLKMHNLNTERFSSLVLDEPLNLVRIILCSGFDLFMLDAPSKFRDATHNGGREPWDATRIEAVLSGLADLGLPEDIGRAVKVFASELLSNPGSSDMSEDFFKAVVSAATTFNQGGENNPVLTLALNDRLNVVNIPKLEYRRRNDNINALIHAVVRFGRGMALMDMHTVLENDVFKKAREINFPMTNRMMSIHSLLFSKESEELFERLKVPHSASLAESRALKERLAAYHQTLSQIREQLHAVPGISGELESICDLLPRRLEQLEKHVANEEREAGYAVSDTGPQPDDDTELKRRFFERLSAKLAKDKSGLTAEEKNKQYLLGEVQYWKNYAKELDRKLIIETRMRSEQPSTEQAEEVLKHHFAMEEEKFKRELADVKDQLQRKVEEEAAAKRTASDTARLQQELATIQQAMQHEKRNKERLQQELRAKEEQLDVANQRLIETQQERDEARKEALRCGSRASAVPEAGRDSWASGVDFNENYRRICNTASSTHGVDVPVSAFEQYQANGLLR